MNNHTKHKFVNLLKMVSLFVMTLFLLNLDAFADNHPVGIEKFNTSESEDKPIITQDGQRLYFNSSKPSKQYQNFYNYDYYEGCRRYDYNIYYSYKTENGWSKSKLLEGGINSSNDDCIVSISKDGKTIYFVSFRIDWEIDGGPFYSAVINGNEVTNITPLGGGIAEFFKNPEYLEYKINNDISYSIYIFGGSISPDGSKFYFATDVKRIYGKIDIWMSELKDGQWQYPVNMGPVINTPGAVNCEPNIAPDGKTLFFTSNAGNGFNGSDIYYSVFDGENWSKPKNAGSSINSSKDDLQIELPIMGNQFSMIKNNSNGNSGNKDIFLADLLKTAMKLPNYSVLNCNIIDDATGEKIDAVVTIRSIEFDFSKNLNTGDNKGGIKIALHRNLSYDLTIIMEGYQPYYLTLSLNDKLTDKEIIKNIRLKRADQLIMDNSDNPSEYHDAHIIVYPNPAKDMLFIDLSSRKNLPLCVELMTITGEILARYELKDFKGERYVIDLFGFISGAYMLSLTYSRGIETIKFIKN